MSDGILGLWYSVARAKKTIRCTLVMVYGHIFTNTYIHIHARTLNLINTSTQLYSYKHLQKVDPPDYSYDCAYMYADIRFILGFFLNRGLY